MEHLQIVYDLLVIMIGLVALSIVVFWASWFHAEEFVSSKNLEIDYN